MNLNRIATFIINFKNRPERKKNILKEFDNKYEFNVTIVDSIKHEIDSIGLWKTLKHILLQLTTDDDEYILLCEDDHQFTVNYSKEILFENINNAIKVGADICCGGVSWFNNAFEIKENFFWVEKFSGLQFVIIFKKFFPQILETDLNVNEQPDYKICEIALNKFFIFPFISIKKDYGYFDITSKNNIEANGSDLFLKCNETVTIIRQIARYFKNLENNNSEFRIETYDHISIPTYIINLPERHERRIHIEKQFEGRSEFDTCIIQACKNDKGALGLWLSIRKIIQIAIENNDDVIIICEDDHEFTKDYKKEYLLRNIIESHELGIDMLIGGVIDMKTVVPIGNTRFWISSFWSTQFIVLYKSTFHIIIDESFDDKVAADEKLSEIIVNKAVLFPFISVQKEFGYSDVSPDYNPYRIERTNNVKFQECIDRFQYIKDVLQVSTLEKNNS